MTKFKELTIDEIENEIKTKKQIEILMNEKFPYKELQYRNRIVAHGIAYGHKNSMTQDWLKKVFLGDIEDGFITYEQVMTIKDDYWRTIEQLKEMF